MESLQGRLGPESWPALSAEERQALWAWLNDQVRGIVSDGASPDSEEIKRRLKKAIEADPEIKKLLAREAFQRAVVAAGLKIAFPSTEKSRSMDEEREG